MTDSVRQHSAPPSLENLPPLPSSDTSSDGSHGSSKNSVQHRPLTLSSEPPPRPFERLAVVDFELDAKEKVIIATEECELPRTLREDKVRIYFAHGIATLNDMKIHPSIMAKLLPRIAVQHQRY
jgi:hypothetical protein